MTAVYQVALESMDFTMVHVHEGYDEAFNTWYENDHFYSGAVLGPGVLSGKRWYCSKALRESRLVGREPLFPDPGMGTNLATYFFTTGGGLAFKEWIKPQLDELWKLGRMFPQRTIVNLDWYQFQNALAYPGASSVPPHVALDHPYAGLVVTFGSGAYAGGEAGSPARDSLTLRFLRKPQYLKLEQPDVSRFDPITLLLTFLTEPVKADREWIGAVSRGAAKIAGVDPLWASGFLPVIPGVPKHLAEMR